MKEFDHLLRAFMELINKIFNPYLDQVVVVFIEDILIYSKGEATNEEHLRISLQLLWEHKL